MSTGPREAAFAAALADLPGAGPAALVRMLRAESPERCWELVRSGRGPAGSTEAEGRERWSQIASRLDPEAWWAPYARRGIRVTWLGAPDFPPVLADDPQPPGVLFWRGDLGRLAAPCVAVVGTRRATADGRRVAWELGADLAAEGVCVVSGLALGIDGAAHEGSVHACRSGGAAGPAGVAASGVDVPYPSRHARLWRDVCELGVMISENSPGRRPEAWRFPTRNRLIAGLARLVVVVESHAKGGSLITAEAAIDRGIEVRAVPGPVHSAASSGSNQLLYDGPGPVRDAQDVLDAIGLFRDRPSCPPAVGAGEPAGLDDVMRRVLDAVPWVARPVGAIVAGCDAPASAVLPTLLRLEELGFVEDRGGWWSRRAPAPGLR